MRIQCPQCESILSVDPAYEGREIRCSGCHEVFEAVPSFPVETSTARMRPVKPARTLKDSLVAIFSLTVFFMCLLPCASSLVMNDKKPDRQPAPERNEAEAKPKAFSPKVGDDVALFSGDAPVPVFIDSKAADEFLQASLANDGVGVAQLIASGRVVAANGGTRARLIEIGFFRHTVRIMEGVHAGFKGEVDAEHIAPLP